MGRNAGAEHGFLEAVQHVEFVDAVEAFAGQRGFNLGVLGDDADVQHHGQDERCGGEVVGAALEGEGVEDAVGGAVVALACVAQQGGDGACHDEEVKVEVLDGVVQAECAVGFGGEAACE